MPDTLNENGLQVKSLNEIIADLETGFKEIYGEDINLASNSPDGQLINLFAQASIDIRELIQETYVSFDPDQASGVVLDQRVTINNIQRKAGSYTIQPIDIVTDRTVNLQGLDADFNNPDGTGFTIQDDAGNQFILIDSATLTAGTTTVNFRSKAIGEVTTTVGTITNPVTVVLGVTSVNNSSGALSVGQDEETDAELRVRRQASVANASAGYLNGLLGTVLAIDGVTSARLYENVTNSVDADGIPAHGIWLIAEGGANTEIADAIYSKKSYGANMKGDVEVEIVTDSGAIFTAKFDRPDEENLYIRFDIQKTAPTATFDQSAIKEYIANNLSYDIGQFAETSEVTAVAKNAIANTGGGGVPVNVEISLNGSDWFDYLTVATLKNKFVLDTTRITITEL